MANQAPANVSPSGFSAAVLQALGIQPTNLAVEALNAMQQGEGQWGASGSWNAASDYNPFNISGGQGVIDQYHLDATERGTQDPGNGPPVDEFTNWQNGVTATANFLKNADPNMFATLQRLGQPNATQQDVQNFFSAAQNSGSFGASAGSRIQFMGNPGNTTPITNGAILNEPSGPGTTGSSAAGTPVQGSAQSNPATTAPPTYLPGSNIDVTGTAANDVPQTPNNTPWPEVQAYIQKNYPSFAWALNEPGVKEVLDQAVRGQWSQTQTQAAVAQTQWWLTTSDSIRQWQELQHTDPGEVQTKISQALRQVQSQAAGLSAQLSQHDLMQIATQTAEFGWSSGQTQAAINTAMGKGGGQSLSQAYLGYLQGNGQQLQFTSENGAIGQTTAADKAYHTAVQQLAAANIGDVPQDVIKSLAMQSIQAGPNWDWQSEIDQLAGKVGTNKYSQGYLQQVLTNPTEFSFSTGKNPAGGATLADQALSYIKQAAAALPLQMSTQQMEQLASHALQEGWIQVNGNGTVSVQGNQLSQELAQQAKKAGIPNVTAAYAQQVLQDPEQMQISAGKTPWTGATTADANLATLRQAAVAAGMNLPLSKIEELTRQGERSGWFTNPDGAAQLGQSLSSAAQELGQAYVAPPYLTALITNPQSVGLTSQGAQGATLADKALNSAINQARSQNLQMPQSVLESLVMQGLPQGWFDANGNPVGDALSNAIGNHASQGKQFGNGYLTGLAADPSNYQFGSKNPGNLANTTAMHIEILASSKGINLNQAQVQELATQAMQHDLPDEQILQKAAEMIQYSQMPQQTGENPGEIVSANAAQAQGRVPTEPVSNDTSLALQLQQQAAAYFESLSPTVMRQWLQGIAGGTQTTQQLQAYLSDQAAQKYPGMASLLQQGLTPQQITNNLTQLASQTLEIDPTQVNYTKNPIFSKMLDGGYNDGPNGTKEANGQMMTYSQAGDYLRGLPQYRQTTNARNQAADFDQAILQALGRAPNG